MAATITLLHAERLDRHVQQEQGCWIFAGAKSEGYGRLRIKQRSYFAHRLAWTIANGPIPEGYEIDHLCRNRACCNPDHLEAVTQQENLRRQAAALFDARRSCKRGHLITAESVRVRIRPDGTRKRECLICKSATDAASKLRRRSSRGL